MESVLAWSESKRTSLTRSMTDDEYNFVRKEEGGFVNDPSDSGGATNRGITQRTYDDYRRAKNIPTRSVRLCTLDETRDIYQQFYESCSANALPRGLAIMHFDFAINSGPVRANRTLQQVLNVTDDGKIGPQTLAAISKTDISTLVTDYMEARKAFYRGLAERRPKDMKFLKGWLLRTDRAYRAALGQIIKV